MRFGKINDFISVRNTFHQIFSDFNTFLAVFGGIFACNMLKKWGFSVILIAEGSEKVRIYHFARESAGFTAL